MRTKLRLSMLLCSSLIFTAADARARQTPLPEDAARALEAFKAQQEGIDGPEQAIKNHAGDAYALYLIGMAYLRGGIPFYVTRGALEGALALSPDSFPDARAALALPLFDLNKAAEAATHAKLALQGGVRDADVLYVLGESAYRRGEFDDALKRADEALSVDSSHGRSVLLRSQALARTGKFAEAADELEKYLSLNPEDPDAEAWRANLQTLRLLQAQPAPAAPGADAYAAQPGAFPFSQVEAKAVILSKPEPGFTEEARRNGVSGLVRLRVTLTPDGRVVSPLVERSLRHGLTAKSLEAALKIKFQPALRGGQPVAQIMTLEYNFNIY